MTVPIPFDDEEGGCGQFDPAPVAARVRAALDSYLRERAPDQRLAFWKAVALGYGGAVEEPAGSAVPPPGATT